MFGIILQIPFTSHEGTKYRINVYKQNFTGTTWVFDGGPEPIVTEEDNDDDPLKPIRSSTGYISFYVDPGSGEYADLDHIVDQILPGKDTDSPVKLEQRVYNSQTQQIEWKIVWQGFLQAAEYSSDWGDPSGVVQLPIISGLEALKSIEFDASETIGMVTIDELFGKVNEQTYELEGGFYKQLLDMGLEYDVAIDCPQELTIDGQNFVDWLNIEVMRYNFIEETDADNTSDPDYAKYTGAFYYDVMSEIMKVFGWCMYEDGKKITMVSRRWGADYAFSTADTYTLDLLTSAGTPSGSEKAVTYANADQKRDVMQGCRAVKLTADTNAISGTVLDVTTDGMVKANLGEWQITHAQIVYTADEFQTPGWGGHGAEQTMHHGYFWCLPPKRCNVAREFYDKNGNWITEDAALFNFLGQDDDVQGTFYEYTDYYALPTDTKYNYSYKNRFTLFANTGWKQYFSVNPDLLTPYVDPSDVYIDWSKVHNMPVLTITQSDPIYTNSGALVLSLNVREIGRYGRISWNYDSMLQGYNYEIVRRDYLFSGNDLFAYGKDRQGETIDNRTIEYSIRVGNKHWSDTQQAWVTGALERCVAQLDVSGAIKNTKTLSMPYNGASGLVLPIETELGGYIELTFYTKNIVRSVVAYPDDNNIEFYTDIRLALSDISVKYYPLDNDINNAIEKENKYVAKCQAGSDDVEIDLKLATKTQVNGPGYGLMMYDGDYLTNQFQIAGSARRPEEALLELAKQLRGSRREILTVNLMEHVKPQDRFIYNGKGYTLLSRTRNWASDESELKMYQVYSE